MVYICSVKPLLLTLILKIMGFLDFLPLIGDVVGGLFGAAGTSSSNATNLQAVRETNQAQRELAEYQWEQNIQQWKRENEYNSPQEQMNRLAQAGLNPYLVYSNGNAIMPAGSSPDYEAPNLQAYQQQASPLQDIGRGVQQAGATMFDNFMRKQLQDAQLTKMYYDNEYTIAKTNTEVVNEQLATLEKALKNGLISKQEIENTYLPDILMSSIRETEAGITKTQEEVENIKKTRDLIDAQIAGQNASTDLTRTQAEEAQKLIQKYQAEIANINQLTKTGQAQQAFIEAQRLGQLINNEWNRQFGSNAPWYAKLLSGFLDNPQYYISKITGFWNSLSTSFGWNKKSLPETLRESVRIGLGAVRK